MGLDGARGRFCASRVFKRWKGAAVAIEAFSRARQGGRAVRLLIVGGGEQLPRLQQQVRQLQLADSVVFIPAVLH